MRVRVTWWEKQYYESYIELDKLPETWQEKGAAHTKAVESDELEMGDTIVGPDDDVFEDADAQPVC